MGGKEGVNSMFKGIVAVCMEGGVQSRRLQIWKEKLQQRGGEIRQHIKKDVTHIFVMTVKLLEDRVGQSGLKNLRALVVKYAWLEDCLKAGHLVPIDPYLLSKTRNKSREAPEKGEESEPNEHPSKHRKIDDDWMIVESEVTHEIERIYDPPNLNKNITDIFGELKTIYGDALGEDFRSYSYHKAISWLEKVSFKITSADEVKKLKLPGFGKSLLDHIDEILKTGTMAKLQNFKEDERVSAITQIAAVWGIGPTTARKLYAKGHRTLTDLMGDETLTTPQKIGLKFHTDINKKILRREVQQMETLVQKSAEGILKNVSVLCGGSYRRGKALVGDMDFVCTHPDGRSHVGFLKKLVQKLKEIDFLTEELLVGMDHKPQEAIRAVDTYFGLCKFPGSEERHRIDLKVYPYDKYPFGLIAWTGNDVLNRKLRLLATSKGYKLDDQGCFPVMKDDEGNDAPNRNCSIQCKTEREVFDFLGFPWLEPHERNL